MNSHVLDLISRCSFSQMPGRKCVAYVISNITNKFLVPDGQRMPSCRQMTHGRQTDASHAQLPAQQGGCLNVSVFMKISTQVFRREEIGIVSTTGGASIHTSPPHSPFDDKAHRAMRLLFPAGRFRASPHACREHELLAGNALPASSIFRSRSSLPRLRSP